MWFPLVLPIFRALASISMGSLESQSPFALLRFGGTASPSEAARRLLSRCILATAIYELWGAGKDYDSLHADVRARTESRWPLHSNSTFRFEMDSYQGRRSMSEQRAIVETFAYMDFKGKVVMKKPDHQFVVFEEYALDEQGNSVGFPHRLFFGRLVAESDRKAINKYTLKKRSYIATTSMDAELSLVTANLAQAAPGRVMYDPFMGTGSFPLCCAHFGAMVLGSDLDGRSIRGKGSRSVLGNFKQYGTSSQYLGGFVADVTNSPLRQKRDLDGIVCDPPYGVREGLKVLGSTRVALQEVVYLADGKPAHLQSNYIPPKKPYSFLRMMDDILDFSADRLVDGGRLCMWMPVAGAPDSDAVGGNGTEPDEKEYDIPRHPALKLDSVCQQDFNKWSRRLITYSRVADREVDGAELAAYKAARLALNDETDDVGKTLSANALNDFRKQVRGFPSSCRHTAQKTDCFPVFLGLQGHQAGRLKEDRLASMARQMMTRLRA